MFYADFIDRCERDGGKVVLAPTVSPEHHGWTPGFARNRNCAFCIAYAHFIFDAAAEGAATLECDADLVERWHAAKALLPDYPTHGDVVVDVEDAPPMTYNIPVPTTPVFPADVGGWPEYRSAEPPADGDHDGMPDAWETAHGLNPADPADGPADADGDGYTNVEEYLNATDPGAPEAGQEGD